jgi:hypothetical protein
MTNRQCLAAALQLTVLISWLPAALANVVLEQGKPGQ